MDPESKKLLQETFALAQDNNKMLHSIKRSQRIASLMRIVYWLVIVGAGVWSLYLIQPYIDKMLSLYNSVSSTEQKLKSDGANSIQDLLKKLGN